MVALVTLGQVDKALRLDLVQSGSPLEYTDERTSDVQLKITQSQAAILRYLKGQADEDWTAETAPAEVSAAIILGVRGLFDGEDNLLAGLKENDPTNPIVGLLWGLRDPALA